MRNPLRASAGKYVIEGSLAPKSIVETGIVNNVYDGYTPPTCTGGSVEFANRLGIRYKGHRFYGSANLTVSGSPRNSVIVGVQGGGGGGSFRFQSGQQGGSGGAGGRGTAQGDLKVGNKPLGKNGDKYITIGGGGGVGDGSGGPGGSSDAFGLTSYGGAGGYASYGPNANGGGGSYATNDGRTIVAGGGITDDIYLGGGGGYGDRWHEYWNPEGTGATGGAAGQVLIRYRVSKLG